MVHCPNCGKDNPDKQSFCFWCGRNLGTEAEYVEKIRKGDRLVLHNPHTDVLFAPFTADSDGGMNIEPGAWGGKFPAQVRVKWSNITVINRASRKFGFLRKRRYCKCDLSTDEFSKIMKEAKLNKPLSNMMSHKKLY